MANIFQDVPYPTRSQVIHFDGSDVTIWPRQLVAWITLVPRGSSLDPIQHRVMPAVLDVGFGGNCWLHEEHVASWAGLDLRQLTHAQAPFERLRGHLFPSYDVDLWLHGAQPPGVEDNLKVRTQFFDQACRLRLGQYGVTINQPAYQHDAGFAELVKVPIGVPPHLQNDPRLPLLGMRLFELNEMSLNVSAGPRTFSLSTNRIDWPHKKS